MTRITTPFGFQSTAAEVAEGIDLSGKRVIVTGAASGIGVETARALARTGAEVTLAVRNIDAGAQVAADITATTGNQDVHVARLDLADRASVAAFVAGWDASYAHFSYLGARIGLANSERRYAFLGGTHKLTLRFCG